jgi:succinyl-CoA synthetase beta subunit
VTASLFTAFQTADALMLEINPLCVQTDGKLSLVGAMVGIDDDALGRQASWLADEAKPEWMFAGRNLNERERAVFAANQRYRGGMIRYSELDGDIGLIFNGGGAGLLQHDLILAMGGRPANHSDMNGINQDKIKALAHAVLDNPNIRGLLISANHLQMTRADRKVEPIMQVLAERGIDYAKFPVVIRMFGPREAEAREAAAMVPGVHYLPSGTPLEDACRLIVDLTRTGVTQ